MLDSYRLEVLKNEAGYEKLVEALKDSQKQRILHALLGIGDESGELQGAIKKHLIYGKEFDPVNIIEEAGDLLWYLVILLDAVDSSIGHAIEVNNKKLAARYAKGFTAKEALNRDLGNERAVLEQATNGTPN